MELPETIDEIKPKDYLVASLTAEERDFSKYGYWKKLHWILAYSMLEDSTPTAKKSLKKLKEFSTASDVKGTIHLQCRI